MPTYQPAGSGLPPDSVIKPTNLLAKLSFIRFGGGLDKYRERLKEDLQLYLARMESPPITRQAIFHWLRGENVPSRRAGLEFLYKYLTDHIDYQSLRPDQKKVFSKIERFLSTKANIHNDRLELSVGDYNEFNITNSQIRDIDIDREIGTYVTYRSTFSDAATKPYAIELLHIFKYKRSVRFRYYYRVDRNAMSRFEGSVLFLGSYMWLLGISDERSGRMRALMARRDDPGGEMSKQYKWGIMLSDVPYAGAKEPAACRVFMQKLTTVENLTLLTAKTVKLADQGDIIHHLGFPSAALVERLVDNHVTAFSVPGSADPAVNEKGVPLRDQVLTVDSRTLLSAAAILAAHEHESIFL